MYTFPVAQADAATRDERRERERRRIVEQRYQHQPQALGKWQVNSSARKIEVNPHFWVCFFSGGATAEVEEVRKRQERELQLDAKYAGIRQKVCVHQQAAAHWERGEELPRCNLSPGCTSD